MDTIKKNITLERAASLHKYIPENERMFISHLKISGPLNVDDFNVLDDMCTSEGTFDEDDNYIIDLENSPALIVLDLGDSTLDDPILPQFTYYPRLETFIAPKNLEGIYNNTFTNFLFLKTVVLPEGFKEFVFCAFAGCGSLENINFPDSLETIGKYAFAWCKSLKRIKIPANVSTIRCGAFEGCYPFDHFEIDENNPYFTMQDRVIFSKDKTKLIAFPPDYENDEYAIPEGVQTIGEGAFLDATIKSIIFPSSLKTIEEMAFRFCEELQILNIPDSVTEIGQSAFEFCTSLNKVKLPNQLTLLNEQIFSNCDKLKELIIPPSVKVIKERALACTSNLEHLVLNDGLEEIKDDLKYTNVKKLFIPKTVKIIQSGLPLVGRSKIQKTEYEVSPENPYFSVIEGSLYSKNKKRLIAVFPANKKQFTVPEGVQIIEDFVFADLDLEIIDLPDTITTIMHCCFDSCTNLRKIELPASLKCIDFQAFKDCSNLIEMFVYAVNPPKITKPCAKCWKFMENAKQLTLYVPKDSVELYRKAQYWRDIKRIQAINI